MNDFHNTVEVITILKVNTVKSLYTADLLEASKYIIAIPNIIQGEDRTRFLHRVLQSAEHTPWILRHTSYSSKNVIWIFRIFFLYI